MKPSTIKSMFGKEIAALLGYLESTDHNGEYDLDYIIRYPLKVVEIIENWKEDAGLDLTPTEERIMDRMIDYGMIIYYAKRD